MNFSHGVNAAKISSEGADSWKTTPKNTASRRSSPLEIREISRRINHLWGFLPDTNYGRDATFSDADRVEVLQFKYSPMRASTPFRAGDAKKTIVKFAESYRDHQRTHGVQAVTEQLYFELITNRPIFRPLQQAIDAIAKGRQPIESAKTQADWFEKAAGITGDALVEFAAKCRITGLAGTLGNMETDLRKTLVDWSATNDAQAGARLGEKRVARIDQQQSTMRLLMH